VLGISSILAERLGQGVQNPMTTFAFHAVQE
jgi:hypothetical protein